MDKKPGGGNQPQPFDPKTGKYGRTEGTIKTSGASYRMSPQDKASDYGVSDPKKNDDQMIKTDYHKVLKKYSEYPEGTYDIVTGKNVEYSDGFQVSFQQTNDNYSQREYNDIVDELTGLTKSNPHVGVYAGTPEVSFRCMDRKQALEIAKKYNQETVLDWKAKSEGMPIECWFIPNPYYDASKNKIDH